jgi:hypothetical protein
MREFNYSKEINAVGTGIIEVLIVNLTSLTDSNDLSK